MTTGLWVRVPDCLPRPPGGMVSAELAGVYRPRHPERTVFYKLLEEYSERYVQEYEER